MLRFGSLLARSFSTETPRAAALKITTFADLHVGQTCQFSKTVSESDISHFVAVTGDVNPLHVNEEFAKRTFFKSRIAHGMLSASLFSTLVGMFIPGTGAIYRSQTLEFLKPVRIGDTITAVFEVDQVDEAANLIGMKSWIENQNHEIVVQGRAVASLMRAKKEST